MTIAGSPISRALSVTGVSTAIAASQAAAAAQAAWFIDPVNGSDAATGLTSGTALKTDRERARRVGAAPITTAIKVTLLGSASSGDYLSPPIVGPGGFVLFTGSPGATTNRTGTLTAAAAQSGNSQGTVSDSSLPTSWAASSLLARRLRITSGARAGAVTWIANEPVAKTAGVGDPETYAVTYPPSVAGTTVTLSTDPYVAELLPEWLILPQNTQVAQFNYTGNTNAMLAFEGISFSDTARTGGAVLYSEAKINQFGTSNTVLFYGCYMGGITGVFTAIACCWEDFGLHTYAGSAIYLLGCVVLGDIFVYQGAAIYPQQGTIFVGGGGNFIDGAMVSQNAQACGFINSSVDGFCVNPPGKVWMSGAMWGSGNAGYGAKVLGQGQLTYTGTPTLTGTSGNAIVGGDVVSWSTIATNGYASASLAGAMPSVATPVVNSAPVALAGSILQVTGTLVAGTKTVASGKTLTNAKILGDPYLSALNATPAAGAAVMVSISGNNVVFTSITALGTTATTDVSSYVVSLVGWT